MKPETAEAEKKAFTSDHRTFAEKEGYSVEWDAARGAWVIFTPRPLRKGEKPQRFHNIGMAWEVAAIRAGRKIGKTVAVEATRPRVMQSKQPPRGRR